VITAILSQPGTVNGDPYTNWSFLVNDGTGSLDIFGHMPTGSTYIPTVGDAINLSGTYSPFDSVPEIGTLTAISKVSSGNPVSGPITATVSQLNQSPLGVGNNPPTTAGEFLFTVADATFSGASAPFGSGNLSLSITDSNASTMTLFYWPSSYSVANQNFYGVSSIQSGVNVTGFVDNFNGTAEFVPISITPYVPPPPPNRHFWVPQGGSGVGGSGSWDNNSNSWNTASDGSGTNSAFTSDMSAVFGGAPGTVTIASGGITSNGLEFDVDGYKIQGATLTLGDTSTSTVVNIINVANVGQTATINSQIAGSSGLQKTGDGMLILGAASNTFSGDVTLGGGTLQVSNTNQLGNSSNIVFAGGTLQFIPSGSQVLSQNLESIAGGGGGLDVGAGNTLTVNGSVGMHGTLVLPSAETIKLTNSGTLGGVLFESTGTLIAGTGSGTLGMGGGIGAESTSGVTTLQSGVEFTGEATISSAAGGKLVITGNISAENGEVLLSGGGTIDLQGANNSGIDTPTGNNNANLQIGATNTVGPIVKIYNSNSLGGGVSAPVIVNFNSGTIFAANPITSAASTPFGSKLGVSFGGSSTQPAILAGADMEFQGSIDFYKPTNTTALELTVNNNTTFDSGLAVGTTTTLGGTGTISGGVILNGTGSLTVNGSPPSTPYGPEDMPITVNGLKVNLNSSTFASTANFTIMGGGKVTIGVDNALNTGSSLTLGDATSNTGGTFATGGHNQTLTTLSVAANSTIDMGHGGSLTFSGGSAGNWISSAILRISDWTPNVTNPTLDAVTPLVIGSSGSLTSELSQIHFTGYLTGAQQLSDGEVVPASTTQLVLGDVNQDSGHHVDAADIVALEQALTNLSAYKALHGFDDADLDDVADINGDGKVNNSDLQAFIYDLQHGGGNLSGSVPEPNSLILLGLAAPTLAFAIRRKRDRRQKSS
jgi:autotransporter-associated beta strand protein